MSVGEKVLLLGLVNDLLSDDAVGLRVAAVLRERLADHPEITVAQTAEMGLSLLDYVTGFDALVIVDAIQTAQAAPGFVHELDASDLPALPALAPHFLGVNEALALGRSLGLQVPSAVKIFAIEVADPFTLGAQLTPALTPVLPKLTAQIEAATLSWCTGRRRREPKNQPQKGT